MLSRKSVHGDIDSSPNDPVLGAPRLSADKHENGKFRPIREQVGRRKVDDGIPGGKL
jgi:hypothetical protein